jgi:GTPase SAR1 family protein
MSTHQRAVAAFAVAMDATAADPALADVHAAIAAQRDRYLEKMSVALIGRVSSGKSTLANALLGGAYAPTGIGELTFNVSWLRHGPEAGVTVHFSGSRPPERRARGDLDALAARARTERARGGQADRSLREYLASIEYLEVTDPNPRLEPFDLVDTPGLDAASGDEGSRKTLEFIGRTADDVREDTIAFASKADALVDVFPKTISAPDMELLAEFTRYGIGVANPVMAVGVLTKIETDWPRHGDPMGEGRRRAAGLLTMPHMRGLMFELLPLGGKMAAAAGVLSEADYEDLRAFNDMPCEALEKALAFAPTFAKAPYPQLPLPAERRRDLFDMLSGYGFFVACGLISNSAGLDEVRVQLAERSGLADLRRRLRDHFARRADVIKLRRAIDEADSVAYRLSTGLDTGLEPRERDQAWCAMAEITALGQEPAFRELASVHDYHAGLLTFTAQEGEELARVTGERGPLLTDRLGVAAGTPLADLARTAADRLRHWSGAMRDPLNRDANRNACQAMLSAYDQISDEIRSAERAAHE